MRLLILIFLMSCSHIKHEGGKGTFSQADFEQMNKAERSLYAVQVIEKEWRDPRGVTLEELKRSPFGKIKRVGLISFETVIQPTVSGLSDEDNIYLSKVGKQKLTDQWFWYFQDQLKNELSRIDVELVSYTKIKSAKAYREYGAKFPMWYYSESSKISSKDIKYYQPGKKLDMERHVLPRGMQDTSMLLVPTYEFLATSKPNEFQRHWINEICKELNLDAIIIVGIESHWKRGGYNKRKRIEEKEEISLKFYASTIYPFTSYLSKDLVEGKKSLRKLNIHLASYASVFSWPYQLAPKGSKSNRNFSAIKKTLLGPLNTKYYSFAELLIYRLSSDIYQARGE